MKTKSPKNYSEHVVFYLLLRGLLYKKWKIFLRRLQRIGGPLGGLSESLLARPQTLSPKIENSNPTPLLDGSWGIVTTYNWGSNPTYTWGNPYKAM